jgi:hypothetical protein
MDALRKLLDRIVKEAFERSAIVAAGKAISFEDYKAKAAYIQALHDVIVWADEAQRELTRPDDEMAQRRVPRR